MTEKKLKPARLTPSELLPPKLTVPLPRQHNNPTISRLIAESMSKPQSPLTPSPAGSAQVRSILERLEQIEIESRDLLTSLFSLVNTDARLEKYIRKRLEDPKVSAMWELVEQVLDSRQGKLDIERMLSEESSVDEAGYCGGSSEKGVRVSDDCGGDDGMRNGRFKVRMFEMDEEEVEVVVVAHPPTS